MPGCIIHILQNLLKIFDPESLISHGGLLIVFLLVYSSTGLFFCFFIPAGAILFTAGIYTATGGLQYDIFTVCSLLILASILGNLTGYWFGWKTGPLFYNRNDSRFFKKQHLKTAETFYNKYGWLALTIGLYLPIIRTFASIVAGIVRLNFRRFILLTVTGSAVWIWSFVSAGYFVGSRPFLKPWLNYIVISFILVVTIPLIAWMINEFRKMQKENKEKE
ncbi:MAG TPA: DedA family protein, partial [Chitinophagaceae bacterium]|nr:DedA family protein [Chitinophagaceae bacterium]